MSVIPSMCDAAGIFCVICNVVPESITVKSLTLTFSLSTWQVHLEQVLQAAVVLVRLYWHHGRLWGL